MMGLGLLTQPTRASATTTPLRRMVNSPGLNVLSLVPIDSSALLIFGYRRCLLDDYHRPRMLCGQRLSIEHRRFRSFHPVRRHPLDLIQIVADVWQRASYLSFAAVNTASRNFKRVISALLR